VVITGSYTAINTVTGRYAATINDDGGPFLSSPFSTGNLTLGVATSPTTFLQIAPASGGSNVGTIQGAIDVALTLTAPGNSAATSVQVSNGGNGATLANGTLHFAANYELFYGNQTDCTTWDASTCIGDSPTTTIGETLTVGFADGAILAVNLYDYSDWNMTPQISFKLASAPTRVPEPGTLAIFGSAIAGLLLLRRRGRGCQRA
jgi:hypothetical protein